MTEHKDQPERVEWQDVPPVKLVCWDIVEHRYVNTHGKEKTATVLRVLGDNDAVGYYRGGADEGELRLAVPLLGDHDLLDHDSMYSRFVQSRLPSAPARAWDIACWDMHARMLEAPLWHFWQQKRDRVMLYGDVRWDWFQDVQEFADCVGHRVHEEGMHAVKLHLPGTWGKTFAGEEPAGLEVTLACLRAAREAAGDEAILAYDPFNPECFPFEENLRVVDTLQECGYE